MACLMFSISGGLPLDRRISLLEKFLCGHQSTLAIAVCLDLTICSMTCCSPGDVTSAPEDVLGFPMYHTLFFVCQTFLPLSSSCVQVAELRVLTCQPCWLNCWAVCRGTAV